jgi:hypothetical protein
MGGVGGKMTRTAKLVVGDYEVAPGSNPTRTWDKSHGVYIAGRAYLDEADQNAADMERYWGAGRLRLLVGAELREKFDRQRYLLNQAVWHGDLESVRRESQRMVRAWLACDRAAREAGKTPLSLEVWEVPLADGSVAAIVPSDAHVQAVDASNRAVRVYTLEEIARLLTAFPDIAKVKATFPGATVTAIRREVEDPLNDIPDTEHALDDEIPF